MAATVAQLVVAIDGDDRGAQAAIGRTNKSLGALNAGIAGIGAAMLLNFRAGTNDAIAFERQMRNVNSIAQMSEADLSAMSDAVVKMALDAGQAPAILAEGLYDIQSAGFSATDAMVVLEVATVAARAGLTTTAVAADGLTSVLNAYGASAQEAEHYANVMFRTVDQGKITFEELSSTIGENAALANSLGVSIEDLGAAYAMMTQQGINYNEASTQINAIMSAFLNPSAAMTEALNASGYASGEALLQAEGLAGALEFLDEASAGSGQALGEMLPNIRALRGATALLNGDYQGFLDAMNASQGAIDPVTGEITELGAMELALKEQSKSTAAALARLSTAFGVLRMQGVQALLPVFRVFAEVLTAVAIALTSLPGPIKTIIAVAAGLIGAWLAAAGAAAFFGVSLGAAAGAALALLGPFLIIVAILGALYIAWNKNLYGIQHLVQRLGKLGKALKEAFLPGKQLEDLFLHTHSKTFNQFANGLLKIADAVGDVVSAFRSGGLDRALDVLQRRLPNLGEGFKDIGKAALNFARTIGEDVGQALARAWEAIPWDAVWSALGDLLSAGFDAARAGLGALGDWVLDVGLPAVGGAILGFAGTAWEWLKAGATWLAGLAPDALSLAAGLGAWTLDVALPALGGAIVDGATSAWEWLKAGATWLAGLAPDALSLAAGFGEWSIDVAVPAVAGAVVNAFSSVWDWLKAKVAWLAGFAGGGGAAYGPGTGALGGSGGFSLFGWDISVDVPGIAGGIVGAFSSAWDWVKSKIQWLADGFVDCAMSVFDLDVPLPTLGGALGAVKDTYTSFCEYLKTVVTWLADIGGTISDAISAFDLDVPLPQIVGAISGYAGSLWDYITQTAAPWLTSVVSKAIDLYLDVYLPKVIGLLTEYAGTLWDLLKAYAPILVDAITQTLDLTLDVAIAAVNVAADFVGTVAGYIAQAAGWAWDGSKFIWNSTVGAVVDVVSGGGGDEVSVPFDPVATQSAVEWLAAYDWSSLATSIQTGVAGAIASVGSWAHGTNGIISTIFLKVAEGQGQGDWTGAFTTEAESLRNGFILAVNGTDFLPVLAAVLGMIGQVTGQQSYIETMGPEAESIRNGLIIAINNLDWSGVPAAIRGGIGDLTGEGWDLGYSLGQGINDGLAFWTSAIAATAAAAVTGAITAARAAAEASSPSKKMIRLGDDLMDGLLLPLRRRKGEVEGAFGGMIGVDAPAAGWSLQGQQAARSGGGSVTNNYFVLTSDELRRMQDDAAAGGNFARSLGGSARLRLASRGR